MTARETEILDAMIACPRAATLLHVDLQNLKWFNLLLGLSAGDDLLRNLERHLRLLGQTWRIKGDHFMTIVAVDHAVDRARAFAWAFHMTLGVTEAWRFQYPDGRTELQPWRALTLACTPRCSLVEIGSDPAADLARVRTATTVLTGFPPRSPRPYVETQPLAPRDRCPGCEQSGPEILDSDIGWSKESCARCGVYERHNVFLVFGHERPGGYA